MTIDIARWLADLGLPQYIEIFQAQGFDDPGLASLEDAELRELGIAAMGHRKIILREAAILAMPLAQTMAPDPDQGRLTAPPLTVQPVRRGRVFLSYGHDEVSTPLVRQIKADLEALGWEPWLDESKIKFSDDWRREITKGIHESQHVLAFLSRHSTRKPGVCRQEIAIAIGPKRGHVYTVLLESPNEVTPPLIISHLQWLDMQEWESKRQADPETANEFYQSKFQQIVEVLERNEPFAGEIEALREWLDPWDGTADQMAAEQGFTGRRWLLDGIVQPPWGQFDDGKEDESPCGEIESWRTLGGGSRVFWISADPGWGKSAVAARLAHAARSHVMAVHFCRHDQPKTRDARSVVRTIAFQMATQLGDYRESLVRLSKQGLALRELNAKELFTRLLGNPMAAGVGGNRDTNGRRLIVLDALDETLEDGQSELVELISSEFGKLPAWLGLLVTSRYETQVERLFSAFGVHRQRETDPRNEEDLRAYTQAWLRTLPLRPDQQEKALQEVCQSSAGMFLYLRKLQEAIANRVIDPERLTEPESLPKGLMALYELWFKHRFRDEANYEHRQLPLLCLMLAAREPLPLSLASHLLNWGVRGQQKALEPLGSLCRLEAGQLTFFHKSLSDWLSSPSDSGNFHASNEEGHRDMAKGLWRAYDRWRATSARLGDDTGWQALSQSGLVYAMRHLPAHLAVAGLHAERRQALTDFALAMRRCAGGDHEALVDDHLAVDVGPVDAELEEWRVTLLAEGHLLTRGQSWWPTHRFLLQMALERSSNSPLRQTAEQWRARDHERWPWLLRELPSTRKSAGNSSFIDLGQGRAVDVLALDVSWLVLRAAVAFASGEVLVFDLKTGRRLQRLESMGLCTRIQLDGNELRCFRKDGSCSHVWLASGSRSNTPGFGERSAHEPVGLGLLRTSRNGVLNVIWDGQGTVAMEALDSSIPPMRQAVPVKSGVTAIAVADDGSRWAVGCRDGSVWHGTSDQTQAPRLLQSGKQPIYGIDIASGGQWLATVGNDGVLRVWDAREGSLRFAEAGHAYRATRVSLEPESRRAVTSGQDGKLIVWNLSSISVGSPRAEVTCISKVPAGTEGTENWVISDAEGRVQIYARRGIDLLMAKSWQAHDREIWDMAATPDGQHLATAGEDGHARVWHRETGTCIADIVSPAGKPFLAVAISPNGRWLAAAGEDKQPQIHDFEVIRNSPQLGESPICLSAGLTLSNRYVIEKLQFLDAAHFVSGDRSGKVRCWAVGSVDSLWEIDHGSECKKHSDKQPQRGSNEKGVYALAISNSGRYLACSGRGVHRGISIWKIGGAAPELLQVLYGHERGVHFLSFRDNDRHLVSASWDETIVMWDWRQRERLLLRPVPQLSAVLSLAEGDRLAVGTGLGELFTLSFQNIPSFINA